MVTTRVQLIRTLSEDLAPELEKRMYFISDAINNFELISRDGCVEAVDLDVSSSDSDTIDEIARKINQTLQREILTQKTVIAKTVWRSLAAATSLSDPFPTLEREGIAFVAGEGQVGFGEPLIALADYLDRRLRAIALSFDGAVEYRYPTLLPTAALERFGYFSSFPQFVMLVTRLHNDTDVYSAFVKDYGVQRAISPDIFTHCVNHDYCLPPTMCYHTYHQHQGRVFNKNLVVTSKGKSFRYESKYHSTMKRLWDFTIREIVFLGTPEFALDCRKAVMDQSFALMEELGLSGTCQVANDHFFISSDTASKIFSQRLMELKYEIQLDTTPGESIAIGSFNYHGDFFGKAFEMTHPSCQPIASGCVGFGIERLVYAFLCQHGVDRLNWPASVAKEID